eukprot:SAG22_NODE_506_length_9643_cov_5.853206_2_plen_307_part_00
MKRMASASGSAGGWQAAAGCAALAGAAFGALCAGGSTAMATSRPAGQRTRGRSGGPRAKTRIGILGGSGPEAGADLFVKILHAHRRKVGAGGYTTDRDAPDIWLASESSIGGPHSAAEDILPGSPGHEPLWTALSTAIVDLAPQVDCFCVCCNQLHTFEGRIRGLLAGIGEPAGKFVSIIEVTTAHCKKLAPASLAIFGNTVTTDLSGPSPYKQLAASMGPAVVKHLSKEHRACLSELIADVKLQGVPGGGGEVTAKMALLLGDMKRDGVEAVVLACTELPMISMRTPGVSLIDPTELLAAELLSR